MPHLLIHGLTVEQVRTISTPMVDELAQLCGTPADHFLLECLHTTAVFNGQIVPSYPFVEVAWFERGSEVRRGFANIVVRHIRALGIPEVELAFRIYTEDAYFINGEPVQASVSPTETVDQLRQDVEKLQQTNAALRQQLRNARKTSTTGSDGNMSSRLRDALRE